MRAEEFRRLMARQRGGRKSGGGRRRKRDELPPAELMWLQIRAAGLPLPKLEHSFHPERKWRLDFAWPDHGLVALEVHGGIWKEGRHIQGQGFTDDREKMNEAALAGWLVIEATTDQVRSGQALTWLERALSDPRLRLPPGHPPAP